MLNPREWILRRRARRVWSSPVRTVRTLEGFARTETDGGNEILAASRMVEDPVLAHHLARHAEDELEHGALFLRRAAELRAALPAGAHVADDTDDRLFDLSRSRSDVRLSEHGFLAAHRIEQLGAVPYVAALHVAEQRAAEQFRIHRALTRDDPATAALFDKVLQDETYHVAWTGKTLRRWEESGRGAEVAEALRAARGNRLLGAWRRMGVLAASHIGKRGLWLFYLTVALPFGLLLKLHRAPTGLVAARGDTPPTSEY